jgi:hypothetical protein
MLRLNTPLIHAPGAALDEEVETSHDEERGRPATLVEEVDLEHTAVRGAHEDAVADLAGEHVRRTDDEDAG